MKIKKIIFFVILLSFCVLPFFSYSQTPSGTGMQVQTAPSYGPGGSTLGMEAQIMQNSGQGSGGTTGTQAEILPNDGSGATIGNQAQINTENSGNTVGSKANFSSTGLFCSLALHPTLKILLNYIACLLSKFIVPLIFSLAIVLFIWGIVQYVINTDDEAKKKKGKQFMIWGIIGLTIMSSVWGLVRVLGKTFGVDTTFIPQLKEKVDNSDNSIPATPLFTPTNNTTNTNTNGGILPDNVENSGSSFVPPSA